MSKKKSINMVLQTQLKKILENYLIDRSGDPVETMRPLIEQGVDLNFNTTKLIISFDGHLITSKVESGEINCGYLRLAVASRNIDLCKFLIDNGANPNGPESCKNISENGFSEYGAPLKLAVQFDDKEITKLLLGVGASMHLSSTENLFAVVFDEGIRRNDFEMAKLFLQQKDFGAKIIKAPSITYEQYIGAMEAVIAGDKSMVDAKIPLIVETRLVATQNSFHASTETHIDDKWNKAFYNKAQEAYKANQIHNMMTTVIDTCGLNEIKIADIIAGYAAWQPDDSSVLGRNSASAAISCDHE